VSELTSKTTETTTNKIDRTTPPRSPKAVLSTSREEFYGQDSEHQPLELIVKEGMTENICQLPEDLQGHVFIVGAVGYINSYKPDPTHYPFVVEPANNGEGWNSLINGEGMIYRLDFHQTTQNDRGEPKKELGKAWMATRLVKTPDYYADRALEDPNFRSERSPYRALFSGIDDGLIKFSNFGLTRVSFLLGTRNYLNTAFLPMKFANGNERLLVTWDVGRPYEIEPRTLGLVAPIGWHEQWYPLIKQNAISWPFPPLLSSAHPVFDTHTDEMFTVNASKSLRTILGGKLLSLYDARDILRSRRWWWLNLPIVKQISSFLLRFSLGKAINFLLWFLKNYFEISGEDRVFLTRWKGAETNIEQWEVVDENQKPISVVQSLHQMAITKDYIVLSDSAFKIVLEDLLPYPSSDNPFIKGLSKLIKDLDPYLSYPQLPYTDLYIISRKSLTSEVNADKVNTVTAKRVRIHPETAHFLADYQNPDGKITLFAGHTVSSDPAEFLHKNDCSIYRGEETQELRERSGMFVSPMDVNRLGCWVIDVKKLRDFESDPEQKKACYHSSLDSFKAEDSQKQEYLFSISLYAWSGFQPDRFTDIYWNCWGAWSELLSQFIFDMYEGYRKRIMGVKKFEEMIRSGQPANLLRMHVDRTSKEPKLKIEDVYHFPPGYFGNSPQFVPRPHTDDPTDGYIVCAVLYDIKPTADENVPYNPFSDKKCELWIFDAQKLCQGPKYRLSHPRLNIGVTIHTTWLSKLEAPPERKDYSVPKDYKDSVDRTGSVAIRSLFKRDIYPHFEN
jgi:carotenoid cleavage dioxygenase-like enzyme